MVSRGMGRGDSGSRAVERRTETGEGMAGRSDQCLALPASRGFDPPRLGS
jgi:hypothetical protein